MKNTLKHVDNRGFSLIELLIAIAILIVLTTAATIGIGISRRRDTERYVKALQNQIQLNQTFSMTKAGEWRLTLYRDSSRHKYYCVQEVKNSSGNGWTEYGNQVELGPEAAISWNPDRSADSDGAVPMPVYTWQFYSDTGAWKDSSGAVGSGTASMDVLRANAKVGKSYDVIVYKENGYCEVVSQ
jgi:prepilin-type N-terminal cleavage/methylation domain-containing protein